jgi:hypothetical protein
VQRPSQMAFRCGTGRPNCEREWRCLTRLPCLQRPKIPVSHLTGWCYSTPVELDGEAADEESVGPGEFPSAPT